MIEGITNTIRSYSYVTASIFTLGVVELYTDHIPSSVLQNAWGWLSGSHAVQVAADAQGFLGRITGAEAVAQAVLSTTRKVQAVVLIGIVGVITYATRSNKENFFERIKRERKALLKRLENMNDKDKRMHEQPEFAIALIEDHTEQFASAFRLIREECREADLNGQKSGS